MHILSIDHHFLRKSVNTTSPEISHRRNLKLLYNSPNSKSKNQSQSHRQNPLTTITTAKFLQKSSKIIPLHHANRTIQKSKKFFKLNENLEISPQNTHHRYTRIEEGRKSGCDRMADQLSMQAEFSEV